MLILLSQKEQGISALYLQKLIFPSGSSSMKSTFPWMQRHYVNYYKGEQLYETNRRETALSHPRDLETIKFPILGCQKGIDGNVIETPGFLYFYSITGADLLQIGLSVYV